MATEDDQGNGARQYTANALRVLTHIVLFPFLWIGIAVNLFGLAERYSFIPGISREGGVVSGIVALVMTALVVGVVVVGTSVATGGSIPITGGWDDDPTAPATPTPTPTSTPTPTPTVTSASTSTPKVTPTSTPERMRDLGRFEADFRNRLNETMQNESFTGVPVLSSEYRETDDGQTELWLVYWECDRLDSLKEQRVAIGNLYAGPAGVLNGEKPARLRVYGVTNLEQYNDTMTYINTSQAESLYYREIEPSTYTKNWYDRQHEPTQSETEIAYQMVVNESGQRLADQAFNQHHREIGGCPGGARDPTPPSKRDSNTQVSASGVLATANPVAP